MATVDLIKMQGRKPANFLDVERAGKVDRMKSAFQIIITADFSVMATCKTPLEQ